MQIFYCLLAVLKKLLLKEVKTINLNEICL